MVVGTIMFVPWYGAFCEAMIPAVPFAYNEDGDGMWLHSCRSIGNCGIGWLFSD